jgi:hypothetical protein
MVAGIHFVQEDSPDEIGRAIADWMEMLADESHSMRQTPKTCRLIAPRHF